jgi:hypothetical protein
MGEEPPPSQGPAGYVGTIETPGETGGAISEVDAGRAQAERGSETGGDVPGLSRRAAKGVEEIVVQARKRAELLEDTPVSVTAISEELAPNLTMRTARSGQNAVVQIRGIGTATAEAADDEYVYWSN